MYGIINYILLMSSKYNNIFEYYVYEVSSFLLFYQFVNLCLLSLFLIGLILNFFFKKYTIKTVILFLCKRFYFIFVLFFFIYTYSDFSLCDTHINKAVGGYLDTNTKKYVAITCVTITAGFLLYKYIPLFYNRVYNYNNNILTIKKQKKDFFDYELNCKDYIIKQDIIIKKEHEIYIQKNEKFIANFTTFKEYLITICNKFNEGHLFYMQNVHSNFNKIQNMNYVIMAIKKKFPNSTTKELIFIKEQKVMLLTNNLNQIKTLLDNSVLKNNQKIIHNIDFVMFRKHQELLEFKIACVSELITNVFNEMSVITDNPVNLKDVEKLKQLVVSLQVLDFNLNDCLNYTELYLPFISNSFSIENVLINTPSTNFHPIINLPLPSCPNVIVKPIDFGDLYLEGLKLTGINLGYIVFYPCLYCSNKIIGTVNPLSSHLFKEAVWYFITFKFFF